MTRPSVAMPLFTLWTFSEKDAVNFTINCQVDFVSCFML